MRLVYLDCPAGIAGDMLLAALIDLGASLDYIHRGLSALPLTEEWSLDVETTRRRGVTAQWARVTIGGKPADAVHTHREPHHDQEASSDGHEKQAHGQGLHPHVHRHDPEQDPDHGQHHSHGPSGDHDQGHGHSHEHAHTHETGHSHGETPSRPYREIKRILDHTHLPERVLRRAQGVFWELAQAEGAVHGTSPDDVHFHEVGSTDAIIDIVGSCLALESLDIDAVESSPLHVGRGFVVAAHGRMPIPAPATLRLLQGLDAYQTDIKGELVTPTGAALIRGLCRRVGPMPLIHVKRVGCGAGSRDMELPNVLRAILADEGDTSEFERDEIVQLSANIDDMAPQLFGALFETLFEAGARDVWVETATMKKSRPGHVLHVLATVGNESDLAARILRETTSLGVRSCRMSRWMLSRAWIDVTTNGGTVRVKVGRHGPEIWNVAPEYEDCLTAAKNSGNPIKYIIDQARKEALLQLEEEP